MEHINPGVTIVTTMAYDMVTENDSNISTEIKSILTGSYGWRENIPQITVKQFGVNGRIEYCADMPASTLWKVSINPDEAIREFEAACLAYNATHANDNPQKIARGKAFAICNAQYEALEIR